MLFLAEVSHLYDAYKASAYAEQDAFHSVAFGHDTRGYALADRPMLEAHLQANIALANNTAFASFYWPRPHPGCEPSALWQPCDFVGHAAGHNVDQQVWYMQGHGKHCGRLPRQPARACRIIQYERVGCGQVHRPHRRGRAL